MTRTSEGEEKVSQMYSVAYTPSYTAVNMMLTKGKKINKFKPSLHAFSTEEKKRKNSGHGFMKFWG